MSAFSETFIIFTSKDCGSCQFFKLQTRTKLVAELKALHLFDVELVEYDTMSIKPSDKYYPKMNDQNVPAYPLFMLVKTSSLREPVEKLVFKIMGFDRAPNGALTQNPTYNFKDISKIVAWAKDNVGLISTLGGSEIPVLNTLPSGGGAEASKTPTIISVKSSAGINYYLPTFVIREDDSDD